MSYFSTFLEYQTAPQNKPVFLSSDDVYITPSTALVIGKTVHFIL